MNAGVRRVVTAEAQGRGIVASDGQVEPIDLGGGACVYELWRAPEGSEAPGSAWSLDPPAGGAVFRIAEFPPAGGDGEAWMHRTPTIDFGVVLEGELVLVMDEGETTLRPGDVFVQRHANHGWVNRSNRRCRMAVVLIDGEH